MSQLLQYICCCCDFSQSPPPPTSAVQVKRKMSAKQTRLNTKYKKQQVILIDDEDRKIKKVKAYCCPICTYYYNHILSCSNCTNCLCINCFESYDEKNVNSHRRMQCPFCNSKRSQFNDYQLEPHSYFDPTKEGFLNKQIRQKLDQQIQAQRQLSKNALQTVPQINQT